MKDVFNICPSANWINIDCTWTRISRPWSLDPIWSIVAFNANLLRKLTYHFHFLKIISIFWSLARNIIYGIRNCSSWCDDAGIITSFFKKNWLFTVNCVSLILQKNFNVTPKKAGFFSPWPSNHQEQWAIFFQRFCFVLFLIFDDFIFLTGGGRFRSDGLHAAASCVAEAGSFCRTPDVFWFPSSRIMPG